MSRVLRSVRKRKKGCTLGAVDVIDREVYAELEVANIDHRCRRGTSTKACVRILRGLRALRRLRLGLDGDRAEGGVRALFDEMAQCNVLHPDKFEAGFNSEAARARRRERRPGTRAAAAPDRGSASAGSRGGRRHGRPRRPSGRSAGPPTSDGRRRAPWSPSRGRESRTRFPAAAAGRAASRRQR